MQGREKHIDAKLIHIKGLVQGVGFRPFIYLLAQKFKLHGWVENTNDGVIIHLEGDGKTIDQFLKSIKKEAPLASHIISIQSSPIPPENFEYFKILRSENTSEQATEISPDIAVCDQCLEDLSNQAHRQNYPFINCTHCGPRFTIIEDLPYDRDKTSMKMFAMCELCRSEYENIYDRRFHAQPIACNHCGPQYSLIEKDVSITDFQQVLIKTSSLLNEGKIIAIKGLGGFHLACDATNEETVKRLRNLKFREGKPFAVMFADVATLGSFAFLNETEKESLRSWQRPIVLLKVKKSLAYSVCKGLKTIGAMLPYMPFHHLLFKELRTPALVLTSGNLSDEPIIISNDLALRTLGSISDAVLIYDRDIYNRTDDSVSFIVNHKTRLLRRSRSYVPSPIYINLPIDGIFAAGAELVNCFAIGKGEQLLLSQHIGDLKNLETLDFYTETYEKFKKLYRFTPSFAVCDLHPDYLSSKFAEQLQVPVVKVQHHHAHLASCMAENSLDEKVIGVSMDGTGYGDDGHIWGAEFMLCDLEEYKRLLHFDYVPMPGGDKATHECWRMGLSYLYHVLGEDFDLRDFDFLRSIEESKINLILQAIDHKINCPLTSSAGRLFDAIAAIINICTEAKFHAEAPMRLESIIDYSEIGSYPFILLKNTISFDPCIRQIMDDLKNDIPVSCISAKFHNTIIQVIQESVLKISKETGVLKVVLSGGSFQNHYILERIENRLTKKGLEVFAQSKIPSNDGGIAVGQIAIAAKRRQLNIS